MENSYFAIAEKNLKTAKTLLDCKDFNESARYCQQYVEKSMKGYIESKGDIDDLKLLSVHNPIPLYKRFCELSGEKSMYEDRRWMSVLKTYYYDTNYPGENFILVDPQDAEECYKFTLDFKERFRKYFSAELTGKSDDKGIKKINAFGDEGL